MGPSKAELIVGTTETDISRGISEFKPQEHKNLRIGKERPSMTDLLSFDVVGMIAQEFGVVRWKLTVKENFLVNLTFIYHQFIFTIHSNTLSSYPPR
jgi:hypothetical protein